MNSCWRALHAFTPAIEPMLHEVVGPYLEQHQDRLHHGFWERHYAGGPHLRIRLKAPSADCEALANELADRLRSWLETRDDRPMSDYRADRAAELLRREGIDPASEDLTFRHGVVVAGEYAEGNRGFASIGARELAEDFRRDRGPLAIDIMRTSDSRVELMFKLYLAQALFVGNGSYAAGSVSYKSHWEGFFVTFESERILERIATSYTHRHAKLVRIAEDLLSQWRAGAFEAPIVERWHQLLKRLFPKVTDLLQSGQSLTPHASSDADVISMRDELFSKARRQSSFVNALWGEPKFLATVHLDVLFQRPRAFVNLLYELVATLGLTPIEKMTLCHHAFRAAEDVSGCNLDDVLRLNMAALVARHEKLPVEQQVFSATTQ